MGINSREDSGAETRRRQAGDAGFVVGDRGGGAGLVVGDRGEGAGTSPVTGCGGAGAGTVLVTGGRRAADAMGGERQMPAARTGARVSRATTDACYWAGPYPSGRYVSAHVSKNRQKIRKSDTPRIRIGGVSDTYPCPIHIGYTIRPFLDVSV